ncbi:hypothetical protein TMUPMC115_0373 [Tetragenococcus muriaticus PMC-11-5]|uniref:Uncharacterized protein n=1 Tax=Tetragenococcus muriaticus PMC-11-5 TaxID=1302649 RepID=A0A091CAB0_9ENTE|nr:hypothetical protein TMUPMC115_0373 [Tetragenococcus muriaticus PMC-11-5]
MDQFFNAARPEITIGGKDQFFISFHYYSLTHSFILLSTPG